MKEEDVLAEAHRLASEFAERTGLRRLGQKYTTEDLEEFAEDPDAFSHFQELFWEAMGFVLDPPTPEKLEEFRRLLAEAEGAWREARMRLPSDPKKEPAPELPPSDGQTAVVQETFFGGVKGRAEEADFESAPTVWRDWLESAEVVVVSNLEDWRLAVEEAREVGVCALDFETTGLDPLQNQIRLVQLAVPVYPPGGRRLVAEDGRTPVPASSARVYIADLFVLPETERAAVLADLADLVADPETVKVGHNLKFDLAFLRAALGHRIACERLFDTMLASQLCAAGDFIPGGQWEGWVREQGYSFAKNDRGQELKTKLLDEHGHVLEFEHDNQKEIKPFYPAHSLQQVAHRHLEVWLPKDLQASDWGGELLSEEQIRYAVKDAAVLLPLYEILKTLLVKNKLAGAAKVEFDCLPAVVEIELSGMPFDAPRARGLLREAEAEAEALREELRRLAQAAGFKPKPKKSKKVLGFNPDSGIDCTDLLWLLAEREGLLAGEKIAVGGEEFDVETRDKTLSRLTGRLPEGSAVRRFAEGLRAYRAAKKRVDFLKKWLEFLHPADDRLHPELRQINPQGVGRFSAKNPNLQQAPRGSEVRELFRAPEGRKLIVADYSAIEMRIMAQLSGDRTLRQAFAEGADVHRFTACRVSSKPLEEVTKEERRAAKAFNFGLIYGMTAETFRHYAETNYGVKMTLEEADAAREAFFKTYPGIAAWHARQKRKIYEDNFEDFWRHEYSRGFYLEKRPCTRTLTKRLRVWPTVERERRGGTGKYRCKAGSVTEIFNTPDQGTGADILKLAMALLYRRLLERGWEDVKLVATVHDELVLEAPEGLAREAAVLLKETMEEAGRKLLPDVPVEVEVGVGDSWAEKA